MKNWLKYILAGAAIGVANVIPGVSGGTIAVVLNVFDVLIAAIAHLRQDCIGSLRVLIPVGIGGVAGILIFSRAITFGYEQFPMQVGFAFMGLIIGTLPLMYRYATGDTKKPNMVTFYIPAAVAMIIVVAISLITPSAGEAGQGAAWMAWLFIAGIAAGAAMIVPGLSGSFVLLLLGVYAQVLAAVSSVSIITLMPVALGVVIGVIGGAMGINVLLKRFPRATYAAIFGLMLGSLPVVFPGFALNLSGAISLFIAYLTAFMANFLLVPSES